MVTDLEAEIKEVYTYAQSYLDLITERNPSDEINCDENKRATVRISVMAKQKKWPKSHRFMGDVFPSILAINGNAMIMTRGHSESTLKGHIEKMRDDTKKEYETYRDKDMVSCIGKCGKHE